jgi:ribosomal protein L37AE/L43A
MKFTNVPYISYVEKCNACDGLKNVSSGIFACNKRNFALGLGYVENCNACDGLKNVSSGIFVCNKCNFALGF